MKKSRGCAGAVASPFFIEGFEVWQCPVKEVNNFSWQLLRLHGHYQKGFLFNNLGIGDQPAIYVQAMELIDNETRKHLNKR